MLNSRVYYGMFLTEHYLDSTTLSVANTRRLLQPKVIWMVWCKSTMELSLRTKKRRQIWGLVSRSTTRN